MYNFKNISITSSKAVGNFSKPTYWIDEAISDGNNVEVDFTVNDEWENTTIKFSDLRTFAIAEGLNTYCFNHSIGGEHVQDAGTFDVDTYLAENLNDAVKAYLGAKGFEAATERRAA